MQGGREADGLLLAQGRRIVEQSLVERNDMQEVPGVAHHVLEMPHENLLV